MNLSSEEYEKIIRNNATEISVLQDTIEKLTNELSVELGENILQTKRVLEHQKSLEETKKLYHHLWQYHQSMQNRSMIRNVQIDEIIYILDEGQRFIYANDQALTFLECTIDKLIGRRIDEVPFDATTKKFLTSIYQSVIAARVRQSSNGLIRVDGEMVSAEAQAEPVINDHDEIIGVIHVIQSGISEKDLGIFYHLETQLNFLSRTENDSDVIIKAFLAGISQFDFVQYGCLCLVDQSSREFGINCSGEISPAVSGRLHSYFMQPDFIQMISSGISQFEMDEYLPNEILQELYGEEIFALAFLPLLFNNLSIGALNLCSSMRKPFTEQRKILLERLATHLANILVLHRTNDKLEDTILKLNQTISDLKIKQQQLIQKSKMESLGVISAGMAHEINQPVQIISLSAENILARLESRENPVSGDYLKKKMETLIGSTTRIKRIVESLRLFAREQSGIFFERFSINEVMSNVLVMVNAQLHKDKIQLELDGFDQKLHVLGNVFRMEQVFLNLFTNAIKAVNEKESRGKLRNFSKHIEVEARQEGEEMRIRFKDNGTGIPEDSRQKIFTPFFTTRQDGEGMGLGLPIVYGIMKEMNGDIRIESEPGEFTIVELLIPAV